jgi:hypothetical protein
VTRTIEEPGSELGRKVQEALLFSGLTASINPPLGVPKRYFCTQR